MGASRKPAKKNEPAPNISALAREHAISRETVRRLRDNGIDLADAAALAVAVATIKGKAESETAPAGRESYSEAKRRRAIADADRAELIAKREAGSMIEVAEVEELMTRLGSEMRSRLLAWIGALPPQLEGLSASRIQTVMKAQVTELLTSIHENRPFKTNP